MRFMLLTPGTGNFYCGSCLRDNALAIALRTQGHDVTVVPLYLPLVTEEPTAASAPVANGRDEAVHMGGINMYLQQKSRLARRLPRFLANLLDRPGLLRFASRRAHLTEAPDLGPMTVSMLRGEHGNQQKEVEKLVEWMATMEKPDVVVLSNVMLAGVVKRVKAALDRPVIATMQGEAPFLDTLPEPFSAQAWQTLAERARDIDLFVPVSRYYGETLRERLGIAIDRTRVIYNGIDLADFAAEPTPGAGRRPRTIGYLARMCRDKGLHTLVDAFVHLQNREELADVRLRIAGVMLHEDRPLVDELRARLRRAGISDKVEFSPNISRAEKLAFLRSLTVMSVPATYGESFGLYVLEALAAGVPVVQPRHGAFPELLEATGGGILCEPNDPASLAEGLARLLLDDDETKHFATTGRRAVMEHFTAERMAGEFADVCMMLCSASP